MSRVNGKSPIPMRKITFPLQGPDEHTTFKDGVAESLVGQYTDFHGYEACVVKAELTEDKKVIMVTIKVPEDVLKAAGVISGNERYPL